MGRHKVNFTLPLLLIIVIEMAAFFYLSAEPGVFSRPSIVRIQTHAGVDGSQDQHEEDQVLTVQLAILGYDSNNLPLAKLNTQSEVQLAAGCFQLLLSDVVCSSILHEKFDFILGRIRANQSSGFASTWKASIPIAYRRLLI